MNGGNAVGIFVSAVAPQTTSQGVKKMDQLLEVNGINLRSATAEEALIVLKEILSDEKAETVAVVAQFNPNSKSLCVCVSVSVLFGIEETCFFICLSTCLSIQDCTVIAG